MPNESGEVDVNCELVTLLDDFVRRLNLCGGSRANKLVEMFECFGVLVKTNGSIRRADIVRFDPKSDGTA